MAAFSFNISDNALHGDKMPGSSPTAKLIYAYFTYIGLTLAYTVSNVPYSALMGVMTGDDLERTKLSGFRFAGAFAGGLLVMGFLPDLVAYFGQGDSAQGYQYTMYVFAALLTVLMLVTFASTKERVQPATNKQTSLKTELADLSSSLPFIILPLLAITLFFYYRELYSGLFFAATMIFMTVLIRRLLASDHSKLSGSQRDMVDLLTNKPWLILLGMGFLTMMFNGIKYGVIAYYFKYYVGNELLTGQYFIALLVVSIFGALNTGKLAEILGKRTLFIASLLLSALFTICFFWLPNDNLGLIFVMGCLSEFFAGGPDEA